MSFCSFLRQPISKLHLPSKRSMKNCKSGSEDDPKDVENVLALCDDSQVLTQSTWRPEAGDSSRQGSRAEGAKWCQGYPFICASGS